MNVKNCYEFRVLSARISRGLKYMTDFDLMLIKSGTEASILLLVSFNDFNHEISGIFMFDFNKSLMCVTNDFF